jgi:hypothetical protein
MPRQRNPTSKTHRRRVERLFEKLDRAEMSPAQRKRLYGDVYEFVLRWVEREDAQHEM